MKGETAALFTLQIDKQKKMGHMNLVAHSGELSLPN